MGWREVRVVGYSLFRVIGIPNGLDEKTNLLNSLFETLTHLVFLCLGTLINSHHSVSLQQKPVQCHSWKILCNLTTP